MPEKGVKTVGMTPLEPEPNPYWSCDSASYAPADVLDWYLSTGWRPDDPVAVETFYYGSGRHSAVYHFVLRRQDESVEMPVVANPAVFRVVAAHRLTTLCSGTDHHTGEAARDDSVCN